MIEKLVNEIPDELMSNNQKSFIIKYLIMRRNILLKIIGKGDLNV